MYSGKHNAFDNLISAKEIEKKYNIPYSTITYYTNLGFFTAIRRRGNKRLYDQNEISARMEKITKLINEGYPLRLIRKKLEI